MFWARFHFFSILGLSRKNWEEITTFSASHHYNIFSGSLFTGELCDLNYNSFMPWSFTRFIMSSFTFLSSDNVLDYSGTAHEASTPTRVSNPGPRIKGTYGIEFLWLFFWMLSLFIYISLAITLIYYSDISLNFNKLVCFYTISVFQLIFYMHAQQGRFTLHNKADTIE